VTAAKRSSFSTKPQPPFDGGCACGAVRYDTARTWPAQSLQRYAEAKAARAAERAPPRFRAK